MLAEFGPRKICMDDIYLELIPFSLSVKGGFFPLLSGGAIKCFPEPNVCMKN